MKKDGTRYLCHVVFQDMSIDWIVLFWGEPCGLSSNSDEPCWVVSGGMKPRIDAIVEYSELPKIKQP